MINIIYAKHELNYKIRYSLFFLILSLCTFVNANQLELLSKASSGDKFAQNDLAIHYQVKGDIEKAIDWYRVAAKQGVAQSQNNLGLFYLYGIGVNKDPKMAMNLFLDASKNNYSLAMINIGVMYERGIGVSEDLDTAFVWYQRASEHGSQRAHGFKGRVFKKINNLVDAEKSFRISADYGDSNSQYELASLLNDSGRTKEAIYWYGKSASQGNNFALTSLGFMYYQGIVIDKDVDKAIKLLTLSADKGHDVAQLLLAGIRLATIEDEKEINEIIDLLEKSADQGNVKAQMALSKVYHAIFEEYKKIDVLEKYYRWSLIAEKFNGIPFLNRVYYESLLPKSRVKDITTDVNLWKPVLNSERPDLEAG